jgi:YHS domain-containing protein
MDPGEHAAGQPTAEQPALQGYCPVSYLLQGKAVKGDPAFQSRYVGELYYLSSSEAKAKFDTDPKKYLPQYDGLCTTALGGSYGTRKPGDPTIFAVLEGKVYLFASERSRRAYDDMPIWFIARAKDVFHQPALKGYCPASYVKRGEAVKGQPGIQASFRGRVYYFADEASKAEFLINPRGVLPQYDGYCAEGVSRGRRYPADPTQFLVRDGKAYLFYDVKTKDKFLASVDESIKEADAQWLKIKDEPLPQ